MYFLLLLHLIKSFPFGHLLQGIPLEQTNSFRLSHPLQEILVNDNGNDGGCNGGGCYGNDGYRYDDDGGSNRKFFYLPSSQIQSFTSTQFQSEFKEFCSKHRIRHEVLSPHLPKSNGLADSSIKNVISFFCQVVSQLQRFPMQSSCLEKFSRVMGFHHLK